MGNTLPTLIMLIFGGTLSLWAVRLAVRAVYFRRRAIRAVGIVRDRNTQSIPDADGETIPLVTVTVEFEDLSGAKRSALSPVACGAISWDHRPELTAGDRVPILYFPDHPEFVWIDSTFNQWVAIIVVGAFGAGVLATGVAYWMGAIR